ncbi:DUF1775 domain-containing protein [Streptomyces sp. NPDC041068]|uniref:DUF1775 domain-containing protein n=1 Tax=Streptomyces sp. NPDC041068 TaxID=3155130 RepID=UPI0033F25139
MFRTSTRAAAAFAGVLAVVCAATLPASAHVNIKDPAEATVGTFPTLTFIVPNERTEAHTKKPQTILPKESASKITNALAKRTPGWKHTIEKSGSGGNPGENVVSFTWTAQSGEAAIHAGEFEEFKVLVGRISDTDKICRALGDCPAAARPRWPGPHGSEPPPLPYRSPRPLSPSGIPQHASAIQELRDRIPRCHSDAASGRPEGLQMTQTSPEPAALPTVRSRPLDPAHQLDPARLNDIAALGHVRVAAHRTEA